jgi:hypothetical protein
MSLRSGLLPTSSWPATDLPALSSTGCSREAVGPGSSSRSSTGCSREAVAPSSSRSSAAASSCVAGASTGLHMYNSLGSAASASMVGVLSAAPSSGTLSTGRASLRRPNQLAELLKALCEAVLRPRPQQGKALALAQLELLAGSHETLHVQLEVAWAWVGPATPTAGFRVGVVGEGEGWVGCCLQSYTCG